jgi:RNA-binding protein
MEENMLTSKQRSYLRSMANGMNSIFQLGKDGVSESFINQIDEALEARELIKITVLNNSEFSARQASDVICSMLECEGIQSIGSKIVLYRKSSRKPKIEFPS